MHILKGIVHKQEHQIQLLKDHNEVMQFNSLKNNLFITGIEEMEDETDEKTAEVVTDFFAQTMRISKPIIVLHATCKGKSTPRGIKVTLKNGKDKSVIFSHGKNLKDVRNSKDQAYFVNNMLPARIQEDKHRQNLTMKLNSKLPDGSKRNMKCNRDRFQVDDKDFYPAVMTPKVTEVLTPNDLECVKNITVTSGEMQYKGKCRFIGYSAKVATTRDVKAAYTKVKRLNPSALHVSCAYRIPGSNVAQL